MIATIASTHPQVASYLSRLDAALAPLPHAEAKDILREIEAHINDAAANKADEAVIDRVLQKLGPPEKLAQSFGTEALMTQASHSFSPWLLLHTTWQWAKTGAKGFLAFLIALMGYGSGLGLTITVLLKAVAPSRVGLWIGPDLLVFGFAPRTPGVHELLGNAYIPVTTAMAFATVVATTQALRWLIRKRAQWSPY
jgi:hypothetical protein